MPRTTIGRSGLTGIGSRWFAWASCGRLALLSSWRTRESSRSCRTSEAAAGTAPGPFSRALQPLVEQLGRDLSRLPGGQPARGGGRAADELLLRVFHPLFAQGCGE